METVYIDVDTQMDFVVPAGALYVPGAERILAQVGKLNREAVSAGNLLIATMDAHSENDVEFKSWPHHCVVGSLGQRKAEQTIVKGMRVIEKQSVDCFTNPEMAEILRVEGVEEAVVYGVVTEICVLNAVRGLLDRGIRVRVVANAVKELNVDARDRFFEEVRGRGGIIA
ncbi:MAG: cysteine hydrolase [Acidobacteria bacterium]|nr:cysteine hydrolase [Acidobacteriota bacterium]